MTAPKLTEAQREAKAAERLTLYPWASLEFEEKAEARGYVRRGLLCMQGEGLGRRLVLTDAGRAALKDGGK